MKKSHEKTKIYFADFETITPNSLEYQKSKKTNVWLWCISPMNNEEYEVGSTLDEFFIHIEKDMENKIIYFHNLSFDGNFIFKWLIKNRPSWFVDPYNSGRKYNYFNVFRQNNKYYSIDIVYRKREKNTRKKKDFTIRFLCTYNLIPASINSLGKTFNIDKINDDDINKLVDKKLIKNKNEFYDLGSFSLKEDNKEAYKIFVEYIKRDVNIAKKAYLNFRNIMEYDNNDAFSKRFNKKNVYLQNTLTAASLVQKLVKNNIYNNDDINIDVKKNFKLKNKEDYELSRMFLSGGFSQYNPIYYNTTLSFEGMSIDINSSYPWSMTQLMPYGPLQEIINEKWKHHLEYVIVDCFFEIKEKYKDLVCLKNKTNDGRRYASNGGGIYYLLKEEFDFYRKIYNIKIKSIKYLYCAAEYYLKPFIYKYYQLKVNADKSGDGAMRGAYKIFINSAYGSFAKKAKYPNLIFVPLEIYEKLKNKEIENLKIIEDGELNIYEPKSFTQQKIDLGEHVLYGINFINLKEPNKYPNLLVGATITAYSRLKLLNTIMEIGINNFIYCDTDSIFFKWNHNKPLPSIVELDDYKLGSWKVEFKFKKGKVLGSKRYAFTNDLGKLKYATGGIKKTNISTFDEAEKLLNNGTLIHNGKLQRAEDENGIFLIEKDVEIKSGKL